MDKKTICIIGLGYIGLPTAVIFASQGHKIIGVDVNEEVIKALNQGKVVIKEPYLDIMVQAAVSSGNLIGSMQPREADVFIICVPTPITEEKKADMSYVISATEGIVPYLKKGNTVILESTSPIGTIQNLICPILSKSSLSIGDELFVAYSPERVLPGQILMELVNNNRIIGGVGIKSAELVRDLYKTFVKGGIYLTDATTAEMCKIVENTYRDVNIAFANELAKLSENFGISVWELIELCNKHPRVNIHQPGPGVGGHCIAVDPWFIVEKDPGTAKIIELSRHINDGMPHYVENKIKNIFKDLQGKKKITILGITYKPNVDDVRESPIVKLIELLEKSEDIEISLVDPYVESFKYLDNDLMIAAKNSDLIILGVNHNEFKELPFDELAKIMRSKNLLDTRNYFSKDIVKSKGFNYILLGENIGSVQ